MQKKRTNKPIIEIKYKKKRGAPPGNQNAKEEITRDKRGAFRMYVDLYDKMMDWIKDYNEGKRKSKKISMSKYICVAVEEKLNRDVEKNIHNKNSHF